MYAHARFALKGAARPSSGPSLDFGCLVTCPDATVTTADLSDSSRQSHRTEEITGF